MSVIESIAKTQASERASRKSAPADDGRQEGAAPSPAVAAPRRVHLDPKKLETQRILGLGAARHPALGAYRMLRTRLLRRVRSNNWRTIAITAAGPGEGKTLTAINLAASIAGEPGQGVILADFDLRRPMISRYLGIRPRVGLADYLQNKTITEEELLVGLDIGNLAVILNDKSIDNSSDLLASSRTRDLLERLKTSFPQSLLILDLPPILSADDALVIAPLVDAFLFVVAEGQATRQDLERAKELLRELEVVGTVLNRSKDSSTSRYDYY